MVDDVRLSQLMDAVVGGVPPAPGPGAVVDAVLLAVRWAVGSVPVLILLVYLAVVAGLLALCVALAPRAPVRATGLWTALAALSLALTWSQMLAFLHWSWAQYAVVHGREGDALSTIILFGHTASSEEAKAHWDPRWAPLYVAQAHAWLRDTRLFEQAWVRVVSGPSAWWWSAEICLFTVAIWPLFMHRAATHTASTALRPAHAAVHMLTGQLVAISVANNLFLRCVAAAASSVTSTTPKRGRASSFSGSAWLAVCFAAPIGMAVVYAHPVDILSILAMHIGPLVLSLLPLFASSAGAAAAPADRQRRRSQWTYTALGLVALVVRVQATRALPLRPGVGLGTVEHAQDLCRQLWTALWSHPAQASIGLDHVGIALSTPLWIAWEQAHDPQRSVGPSRAQETDRKDMPPRPAHGRPVGTCTTVAVAAAASIVLGPSATLAFWCAYRP